MPASKCQILNISLCNDLEWMGIIHRIADNKAKFDDWVQFMKCSLLEAKDRAEASPEIQRILNRMEEMAMTHTNWLVSGSEMKQLME